MDSAVADGSSPATPTPSTSNRAILVVMDTCEVDDAEDGAVVVNPGYASWVPRRKVAERIHVGFESGVNCYWTALAIYGIGGITHCRHHISETESVADVVAAIRAQTEPAHLFGARRARQRADAELPPLPGHKD